MTTYFERPVGLIQRQSKFSAREVGLTHPDTQSYIKLADNGDILIMGGPSLGIIISPSRDAIILVANNVKFLTNEDEGLKWNEKVFNYDAEVYTESALTSSKNTISGLYDDIADYLE